MATYCVRQRPVSWRHEAITWPNVDFILSEILWHSPKIIVPETAQATILYIKFEKYTFEITATYLIGQRVN